MNKWFMSRSRRERSTLLIGAAILVFGVVIYPLAKKSAAIRAEQMEELDQVRSLLLDYQSVLDSQADLEAEHEQLSGLMSATDGFLFERTGNNVMMEAMMTKLLNQFGPDLKLDVSESRAALRDDANRIRFNVKGAGRYPDILNFMHQMELYRPFIVIDSVSVAVADPRANRRGPGFLMQAAAAAKKTETTEPNIRLQLNIHINCTPQEDAS
jgi:hypothetical protein